MRSWKLQTGQLHMILKKVVAKVVEVEMIFLMYDTAHALSLTQ